MALYRDPLVARCTETSDFTIRELRDADPPISLYLVVPPADKDRLKPLVRLILNQVARTLTESLDPQTGRPAARRLLLLIDEFPALGKLEVFQESLAYFAGYGLKAYLITQDLTQLHAAYGRDESLVSNCQVRIASAPNRIETAELLSKMAGSMTVHHTTRTYTGGRLNPMLMHLMAAEQDTERRLLTPDEALRLPADDLLLFVAGHAPIYGKKIKYYNDKEFTRRARISTPTTADRRPPATENTLGAGTSAPPALDGEVAPDQIGPSPTRAKLEASDPPGRDQEPADPPGATPPERDAHRSWRRRTAPATGQELDLVDRATASQEVVVAPEQASTERPLLAPDRLNTQRLVDEEQQYKRHPHPPHRRRGKEPELER